MDDAAEVRLGVEEDQVALQRGDNVLFLGVELLDDGRHAVGKAHALHALPVVGRVREEEPAPPGVKDISLGKQARTLLDVVTARELASRGNSFGEQNVEESNGASDDGEHQQINITLHKRGDGETNEKVGPDVTTEEEFKVERDTQRSQHTTGSEESAHHPASIGSNPIQACLHRGGTQVSGQNYRYSVDQEKERLGVNVVAARHRVDVAFLSSVVRPVRDDGAGRHTQGPGQATKQAQRSRQGQRSVNAQTSP